MNASPQEQETDGIASRAPGPFAVTDAESGAPAVAAAWIPTERGGETIHVHKTAPMWIVCYEGITAADYIRPTYWQVYRAIEPVKRGAKVWSADNKKLSARGYSSLEEAFAAGEAWILEDWIRSSGLVKP
jgi:hypothetical protein